MLAQKSSLKMSRDRADPLSDPYYWKKITVALIVNVLTVPGTIVFLIWLGLIEEPFEKVLIDFRNNHFAFFWPWSQFFNFFRINTIAPALIEEFFSRGPIRILIWVLLPFLNPKRKLKWLFLPIIWAIGLILNYQWALVHTAHELAWIPVFVAGLPWLWLVIETKRLFPAMFCHAAVNLSIYFLIKIYRSFV